MKSNFYIQSEKGVNRVWEGSEQVDPRTFQQYQWVDQEVRGKDVNKDKMSERNNLLNHMDNTINEVTKNNLTRGKIFIAIDNIYQRCANNN